MNVCPAVESRCLAVEKQVVNLEFRFAAATPFQSEPLAEQARNLLRPGHFRLGLDEQQLNGSVPCLLFHGCLYRYGS